MFGKLTGLAALGLIYAGAAVAADANLYHYNPPPKGDPVYSPHSMVIGDLRFAGGVASSGGDSVLFGTGGGSATFNLRNDWLFTGEVAAVSSGVLMGYGHLYKFHHHGAVGAYGGIGVFGGTGVVQVGLEGVTWAHQNFALGGDVGYVAPVDGGEGVVMAGINATHYFSPYTKLRGEVRYFGATTSAYAATGILSHQFNGGPIVGSAQLGVAGAAGETVVSALAGLTVLFVPPGTTLQQYDKQAPFKAGHDFGL